jgi:hypothetical protein
MPSGANSCASASDRPSRANLLALYVPAPGVPVKPPTEEILTIQPARWARKVGSTARINSRALKKLVSKTSSS